MYKTKRFDVLTRNNSVARRLAFSVRNAIQCLYREKKQITQAPLSAFESLETRQLLSGPAAPVTVGLTVSLTGANVTWLDAAWDETGYTVERQAWNNGFAPIASVPANSTNFWDSSVSSNVLYTYRVTAFNASGASAAIVSNSVTTPTVAPSAIATPAATVSPSASPVLSGAPNAPSSLNTFATSGTSVLLAWGDNSGGKAAGFKIERKSVNGDYVTIATVGPVTNYTDTAYSGGVTPGTTYAYRVRAYNYVSDSYASNESVVSTPGSSPIVTAPIFIAPLVAAPTAAPTSVPNAPYGLTVAATSSTTVQLNWTGNNGGKETGFKVERSNGGGFAAIVTLPAGTSTYTDNTYAGGVTPGTTYIYRVRAYNGYGDSGYSNSNSTITPGTSPATQTQPTPVVTAPVVVTPAQPVAPTNAAGFPNAPTSLSTNATSGSTIVLNWNGNNGGTEVGFKIERKTGGGAFTTVTIVGKGVASYTDDLYHGGVTPGVQYTYRVRAYNSKGDGAYSNESSVTTPGGIQVYVPPTYTQLTPTSWTPADTQGKFVIGVYRQPVQSLASWKARGINMTVFFYDNPVWMAEYIATCQALGISEIRNPQANIYADRSDPYLMAYSHEDEPDINGIPTSTLAAEYATWKAAMPNIPVVVNVSGGDVLRPNFPANKDQIYQGIFNTADWVNSDVYPVSAWSHPQWIDKAAVLSPVGDPYYSTIPFNSGNAIDKIRQLTGGKKQFNYIESSWQRNTALPSIGSRVPTPDEFRGEVWDSIIHGTKGIIYFPHAFFPDEPDATPPEIVTEMTKTNSLIQTYGGALNAIPDTISNYVNLPGGLEATYRDYNGHRYYFVLNFSHTGVSNQTISLPGLGTGAVEVTTEARNVFASNGTITDTFTPYQMHVYRV